MSAETARVSNASTDRLVSGWPQKKRASRRLPTGSVVNFLVCAPALLVACAVWMVWSIVVVHLPAIGFTFTVNQLFWLAALPALSGATLRIFYSLMAPVFGGRRWTAVSTATLLLPALGIGFALQDPTTGYPTLIVLALLCGLGGGNLAAGIASTSVLFGRDRESAALRLNAGLGHLGVSLAQFVVPLAVTVGVFGALAGEPQALAQEAGASLLWLQNAGFIWVPFILAATLAAWFGMSDVADARVSLAERAIVVKRKHNWLAGWLYIGTFGSFIGYAAAFPLLATLHFPHAPVLAYAFVGPLAGALVQPLGGLLAQRLGGGRVTCCAFFGMALGLVGVLWFLPADASGGSFHGVLAMFVLLFVMAGIGNGSLYRMIPAAFVIERARRAAAKDAGKDEQALRDAREEAAAALGFTSAIGAYGGFFIPKSYGSSIALTGGPQAALYVFIAFYITCMAIAWWYYGRKRAKTPC